MTWYRRREQPIRIAVWYGTNGVASMLGSLLAYGLSFIVSPVLYVYQILFLTVGLATVITAPCTCGPKVSCLLVYHSGLSQ
jgi:hypothetical protein